MIFKTALISLNIILSRNNISRAAGEGSFPRPAAPAAAAGRQLQGRAADFFPYPLAVRERPTKAFSQKYRLLLPLKKRDTLQLWRNFFRDYVTLRCISARSTQTSTFLLFFTLLQYPERQNRYPITLFYAPIMKNSGLFTQIPKNQYLFTIFLKNLPYNWKALGISFLSLRFFDGYRAYPSNRLYAL
jgi:hypothetical protein